MKLLMCAKAEGALKICLFIVPRDTSLLLLSWKLKKSAKMAKKNMRRRKLTNYQTAVVMIMMIIIILMMMMGELCKRGLACLTWNSLRTIFTYSRSALSEIAQFFLFLIFQTLSAILLILCWQPWPMHSTAINVFAVSVVVVVVFVVSVVVVVGIICSTKLISRTTSRAQRKLIQLILYFFIVIKLP